MSQDVIEAEIWSSADPPVFLDTMPGASDIKYMDELYGPGSGSITVPASDPRVLANPALLAKRNIVRIKVNGNFHGAFVIQKTSDTWIGDGDSTAQVHEVSGEGLRTWLNDAVLTAEYPGYNTATTLSNRNFNFASARTGSTWYEPDKWVTPTGQTHFNNRVVYKRSRDHYGNPWIYFPVDWADGAATWIWDRDTRSLAGAPGGSVYFRREFDLALGAATLTDALGNQTPIGGDYTIYVTCDNGYKVYLDSMELGGSDTTTSWRTLGTYTVTLATGFHTLAVHCINVNRSTAEPSVAGLLVAVYEEASPITNADGTLIVYPDPSVIVHNRHLIFDSQPTSSWKMCAYPSARPGWNMGEIIKKLWAEAAGRGVRAFSLLGLGFDRTNDSYGNPWLTRFEWSLNVGDDYTQLFQQFEALAADFWIDPRTFTLMAYNTKGYDRTGGDAGAGHPPDGKTSIYLSPVRNLIASSEDIEADPKTAALLMSKGRWSWVTRTAGTTLWGRIETFVSVADQEQLFATKIAAWTLDEKLINTKSAAVSFEPDPETRPFEDFGLGDWILVESRMDGIAYPRRVMSIALESNDNAVVTWAVELDTPEKSRQSLIDRRIRALSMGGSSVIPGSAGTVAAVGNQAAVNKTVPISSAAKVTSPPPKPNPPSFTAPPGRPAVPAPSVTSYLASVNVMRGLGSARWYSPAEAVDESDVIIAFFPLQVRDSPGSTWVALPDVMCIPNTIAGVTLQQVLIQDMQLGKPYSFRVAATSIYGMQSDWVGFNLTAPVDTAPPPVPTRPLVTVWA